MQKKILLVDDESSLRRTMTLGLSQAGYDTEPCESGIKALKTLETYSQNNIPLAGIVVDIHLPDINGLKLVKIMQFKYPGIPIVVITGFADRYNLEEIRNLNVTALMEKPFTPEELVQQFVKTMETKAVEEEPEELENAASAFVLLKVEEKNYFDANKQLHVLESVVYCDATKGDFDVFMMLQADSKEKIRQIVDKNIKTVKGVQSVDILDVEVPILDDSTQNIIKDVEHVLDYYTAVSGEENDGKVCAYLLMEIEKEKLQDIYLSMRLNEDVVFCDYTSGKFSMVSMIRSESFGDIDRLINDKINPLEGVVKVKKYPVIKLFEM